MALETIVPRQITCAALAKYLVQGKSELAWIEHGGISRVVERESLQFYSYHPKIVLDAPTASELGEMVPMNCWRLFNDGHWHCQVEINHTVHHMSETEARAQLVLWLAENRPESLGEWIKGAV